MPENTSDARLIRIAEALLNKTLRREIEWEAQVFRSREQFDFSTERSTISIISESADDDVIMIVKNDHGIELDRLTADAYVNPDVAETLNSLFAAARRQALDVDARLNELATALGVDDDDHPF